MTDWSVVKTEYITTDTNYRALAKKYGVSLSTVMRHAQKEGWILARTRHQDKVTTKLIAAEARKQIDRYTRLLTVADKLLDKIENTVNTMTDAEAAIDKGTFRSLTSALKDIKDIQGLKPDADVREQEARIAKLRREADAETGDRKIEIVISGEAEEYAE